MPEKVLRTESASPLYEQLMEQIRFDILRGTYPVGEKIPTERELEERYSVSRVTVRRALQELTAGGMLERKQGKGTFVAEPKQEIGRPGVQDFFDACRKAGKKPAAILVSFREAAASETDRIRLKLEPDASVLEICRVLTADGEPVILERIRFSMAYVWLENANLRGSLYPLLQEYGVQAEKSIYDFSLRKVSAAEAEMLRMEEGGTAMLEEQVVYDQKGRPLHVSELLIRGDRFTVRI